MSSWDHPDFVREYSSNAADTQKNWYEHELNFPSLVQMIPQDAQRVLDYGCGTGEFTVKLARLFPEVEGCDYSEEMIKLAKASCPDMNYFCLERPSEYSKSRFI